MIVLWLRDGLKGQCNQIWSLFIQYSHHSGSQLSQPSDSANFLAHNLLFRSFLRGLRYCSINSSFQVDYSLLKQKRKIVYKCKR